jgi:flavin-dependent thymidylate synthase
LVGETTSRSGEISRKGEEVKIALTDKNGNVYWEAVELEDLNEPSKEVSTYVDKAMYEAEPMKDVMPKVTLLSATPDPLGAIAAFAFMYKGRVIRDLAELTDDDRRWAWEQANATHLKAPLEAVDLHFMVEGVTRAFTHQMVRQRTAVYAQESMRFAVKEDIAARPGPLVNESRQARTTWNNTVEHIWKGYKSLIANGVPAEEARGLLPHDTLTRLNYKTNLRNLVDHLGNRLCTQAQFEWRLVGAQIVKAIGEYDSNYKHPGITSRFGGDSWDGSNWQFQMIADSNLFRPVCYAQGKCPFQADFDRGCTIRERVDAGRFDEIKTEEWLADPTAGWIR